MNTPESTQPKHPDTIECLVVGGVADGVYLRNVRADADVIRLSRPMYVKPLASSTQNQPDVAKEMEDYRVWTLLLDGPNDTDFVLGFAVPVNTSLAEAFSQIVVKYVKQTIEDEQETDNSTLRKFDA